VKKKVLKIIALVIALALSTGQALTANSLIGNPISKMLAQKAANEYLETHFPSTDYYIDELGFSFKFVGYYAHVRSESSIDTQFSLNIDMVGNVFFDTYDSVKRGFVTARRLDQEYRELTNQIFESTAFPYPTDIGYGTLEIHPQEATDKPDYAIAQESLVMDRIYDSRELGAQAGHLIVYVENDAVSMEKAAEIILHIKNEFDTANIPFRAIDFVLRYPIDENGKRGGESIRIEDFRYEDIYKENLTDRITKAHMELEAYYAEQDSKYK